MSRLVRAAGGVVLGDEGTLLVVHRPRYDDWSFPKGKVAGDETDEECALREVEEETGLRCVLRDELGSTSYTDGRGRPKRVRYWLMNPAGGELEFRHEVDDARWLSIADTRGLLTYQHDVELLESLA